MGACTYDDNSVIHACADVVLYCISSLSLLVRYDWQTRPDDKMSNSMTPTSLFIPVRIGRSPDTNNK